MSLFRGFTEAIFGGGSEQRDKGLDALQNVPLPVLKEINPELYAQVIKMNPTLEQAVTLGPSEMQGIALDPRLQQAQMQALGKLQEITENDGQDAQSKADNARLVQNVNSNLKGNTQAIQQNMAVRGLSGGMSELVGKQMAAQEAANRQAQLEMDINAQAQQRALSALMNQGQMAGQMENASFNQQAQRAQAGDAISRFNAQNLQNVRHSNVDNQNRSQEFNIKNQQRLNEANTDMRNRAKEFNTNGLAQQNYENQMRKAGGIAAQRNEMGRQDDWRSEKDREAITGLATSIFGRGK